MIQFIAIIFVGYLIVQAWNHYNEEHAIEIDLWATIGIMLLLILSGCASAPTARDRALMSAGQAAATLPSMSDSELTCLPEPNVPEPRAGATKRRESQVQDYILDLRLAGADCRDRLGVVKRVWRKVEEVKSRAIPPEGDVQ